MRIGLLGLAFGSTNKGCEALGFGFMNVLQEIASHHDELFDIYIFQTCDISRIYENGFYNNLNIQSVFVPGIGSIEHWKEHIDKYSECDIIFDFTAGDSFSDIYGLKRFVRRTFIKELVIISRTPLVLGSQTYGPYKTLFAKVLASYVIKKSKYVFARDVFSSKLVKKMTGRDAITTVDVAFAMQYERQKKNTDRMTIGFNPSGLLWQGGYKKTNQFNLKVNYRQYCMSVLKALVQKNNYRVVLVPHVISKDLDEIDNDLVACNYLLESIPQLEMAPCFDSPIEAKSYISGLDMFIGARMHAAIAAFTTGVPVLPFSYSPKFEGVFSSLNYDHVLSATKVGTDEAVKITLEFCAKNVGNHVMMNAYKESITKGTDYLISRVEDSIYGR